ncbi:autotransporter assembly complex family protein [Roseobacter sp. HKCCA0434]|uniref:autotransporter assembly complex protein TamA n=1 Tax=Roseobacter sp. HKCCA0434 TaxID=3079297 RepID=UPI0029058A12|nr:autotransporter assembly complex family protein [Roseobacter sp. HKCCA0434]
MNRIFLLLAGIGLLAACGRDDLGFDVPPPSDSVDYDVTITGAPTEDVEELAEETLALYRRQEDGAASPAFLRRRADNDIDTMQSILQSEGYYQAEVTRDVTGEGETLAVEMAIEPGPAFTLTRHEFDLTGPTAPAGFPGPAELGSPIGERAQAIRILEAEDAAVAWLRNAGYAYAEFVERDAVADPATATLTVTTTIDEGRPHTFGPVSYVGLTAVEREYLDTYIPWVPGQTYDALTLREFQQDLVRTELFNTVTAEPPEEEPGTTALPITVTVDERKERTISAGLRYDTEAGLGLTASLEHRNLLGRNENALFDVKLGLEESAVGLSFRVPQFRRDGQTATFQTRLTQTDEDAFEGTTFTIGGGLERELTDEWRGGVSAVYELSDVEENGVPTDISIVGLPTFVAYDNTDDLLDPRSGRRARLVVSPFAGTVNDDSVTFLRLDGRASFYLPIDEEREFVLATRGRVGSILAEDVFDVPVTRRLFSGGGGSVRGFANRSLGPEDASGDARGGLSVFEIGTELRYPIRGNIGGVAFVEAGQVSDSVTPEFDDLRLSFGAGVRYYSPIGPVRADLAFPVDPDDNEDVFQFYLAIGQAF